MLVSYSRTPTISIVKQNNVRQIGKRLGSLKKIIDNRLNYPRSRKKSRKFNNGKMQNNGWLNISIRNGRNVIQRTMSALIVCGKIVAETLPLGTSLINTMLKSIDVIL